MTATPTGAPHAVLNALATEAARQALASCCGARRWVAGMLARRPFTSTEALYAAAAEVWQGLESAIVSIVLTLPSNSQAEILSEWLQSKHVRYPDLTEAFEAWCYRSKVAKRRLSFLSNIDGVS